MIKTHAKGCKAYEEHKGAERKEPTFLCAEEACEIAQLTGRWHGLIGLGFEHNRNFNRGTRLDSVGSRVVRALA